MIKLIKEKSEMSEDISNSSLLQKISMEFVVGLVVMFITVGTAWGTLSSNVSAMESKIQEAKIETKEMAESDAKLKEDVSGLRTDVEVIKANQAHFTEKIDDIDRDLALILQEVRAIRRQ